MTTAGENGNLQLIGYSVLTGSVGIAVRLTEGLSPQAITFFRFLIGAIFVLIALGFAKELKEIKPKHFGKTLLLGATQATAVILYFAAILKTSIAVAMFLLYTAPVFSLFFAKILFKEKIEQKTIAGIIITLLGVLLLVDPQVLFGSGGNLTGVLLGLGGGFFFAAMGMIAKDLSKDVSGEYLVFWKLALSAGFALFAVNNISLEILRVNMWVLLYIGVFTAGIAFWLFMDGIKEVPAQKIFIITTLEPLTGTFLAAVIFNEVPSPISAIGALLILGGVFIVTTQRHELSRKIRRTA